MADTVTIKSGGIGVGGIIAIVLVILKATGNIGMSWFWVITSFIWAPLGIFILLSIALFILVVIAAALS